MIGKKEPKIVQPERQELQKFGAGQMKQIVLPIGTTLEETLLLVGEMCGLKQFQNPNRRQQIITLQLLHQQKSCGQSADQIHNRAQSEIDIASAREEVDPSKMTSKELPSVLEREILIMHRRYEKAISTYSFQVLMKQKGFEIDRPSFYKIA